MTSWASETSLKHLPRRNRPPGQPGAKHTRIGYTPGIRGHVRRGLVAPGETTYGHPTHLLRALFSLILGIRRGIRRIYIYTYISVLAWVSPVTPVTSSTSLTSHAWPQGGP